MDRTRKTAWLIMVMATFLLPGGAMADTVGLSIGSSVNATGTQASSPQVFNVNLAPGPVLVVSPALSIVNSNGSASLSGSVQFGSISGSLSTAASSSSTTDAGEAQFFGVWQDSLTMTSNTLAAGTPVSLLFTLSFDSSVACTGANTSPQVTAGFQAGSQQILASSTACNTTFQGTRQLNVNTMVGATMAIEGQLLLAAVAGQGSTVQVDPPTNFFIDPMTLGASYTTGSGTSYLTPQTSVPEPASALLLGIGIVGLLACRRSGVRRQHP